MGWRDLDTSAWNLGTLALGVGACGPIVVLPEDTDGDPDPDDDDTPPDGTETFPTATDTVGPGCGNGPACPPGYVCEYGECVYEYYCDSCCVGECGGYYECFGHDDCNDREYCNYYVCSYLSYVYDCGFRISLGLELIADVPGTLSMTFADTNGDGFADLAQLADPTSWVFRGPDGSEMVPIDTFGADGGGALVATDVDGTGPTELTFSLFESDVLMTVDASGVPMPLSVSDPALAWPVAGDFDADGRDDVAGRTGSTMVYLFSDGLGFGMGSQFGGTIPPPLAVGDLGENPGEDLAYADGWVSVAELWPDGGSVTVLDELHPLSLRSAVVGDFDGNGVDDVLAIGQRAGGQYSMFATWNQYAPGQFGRLPYQAVPTLQPTVDGQFAAAVGDFDGDGADDVLVGGNGSVTLFFGQPGGVGQLACWQSFQVHDVARFVAAGDHDGNGRDDIAWSDGVNYTRVLLVQ